MESYLSLSRTEAGILLLFLLAASIFPHWMYINSNSRLDLTRAMVDAGSTEITPYAGNTWDKVVLGNRTFSDKSPGSSLMALPVYTAYRAVAGPPPVIDPGAEDTVPIDSSTKYVQSHPDTFLDLDASRNEILLQFLLIILLSALPAALTLLLVFRLLRHEGFTPEVSGAVALLLGFSTNVFFYSTTFMANTLAMFFGFAAFYVLRKWEHSRRSIVAAGVLAGVAGLMEYYALIIPGILALHALWTRGRPSFLHFTGGAALGFLPSLLYNAATTGNPLLPPKLAQGIGSVPLMAKTIFEVTPGSFHLILPGFVFSPVYTPIQLARLLFLPGRGLFLYSPILLAAVPGIVLLYRKDRKTTAMVGGMFASFLLFNAGYIAWYGGPALGPRYLVPMFPFLALPLAYGMKELWNRGPPFRALLVAAVLISTYIAFLGFNGTSLHPEVSSAGEASQRLVVLNPLPDYHSGFIENGPTSPWVTMLSGVPETGLNFRFRGDQDLLNLGTRNGEFLVLTSNGIELVVLLLLLIAFGSWTGLVRGADRSLVIPLAVLLAAAAVTVPLAYQSTFKGSGWYAGNATVTSEKATLYRYSEGSDRFVEMDARPVVNHSSLLLTRYGETREIRSTSRPVRVELDRGINRMVLESSRGCVRPALQSGSADLRCLSFEFDNMSVRRYSELPMKGDAVYAYNWYPAGEEGHWMPQDGTVYLPGTNRSRLVRFNASPSHIPDKERVLEVSVDRRTLASFNLSRESELAVPLPADSDERRITFTSSPGCSVPAEHSEASNDSRCLSFRISNIHFMEGEKLVPASRAQGGSAWKGPMYGFYVYRDDPGIAVILMDPGAVDLGSRKNPLRIEVLQEGETIATSNLYTATPVLATAGVPAGVTGFQLARDCGNICPPLPLPEISLLENPPALLFGQNWYSSETVGGRTYRWMADDAVIYLNNPGGSVETRIVLGLLPFTENVESRHLTVSMNGEERSEVLQGRSVVNLSGTLEPGVNTLTLRSREPCGIPSRHLEGSQDERCLSFNLLGMQIETSPSTNASRSFTVPLDRRKIQKGPVFPGGSGG